MYAAQFNFMDTMLSEEYLKKVSLAQVHLYDFLEITQM